MGEVIQLPNAVLRPNGPELHVRPDMLFDGFYIQLVQGSSVTAYQPNFAHAEDALAFAGKLAKLRGWRIVDHTGPEPERAA